MTRVTVIDHGAGNLVSIVEGLKRAGAEVTVATDPQQLRGASGIVLPGVGSSGAAMERLDARGFSPALIAWEGPLLGICVGFQVLFGSSAEAVTPCLGILPGTVDRLSGRPLPHMGWNDISIQRTDPLLGATGGSELFYFAHTYAPVTIDPAVVLATAVFDGQTFVAAARRGPVVGVQFHPERSGIAGRRLLSRFVHTCRDAARAA